MSIISVDRSQSGKSVVRADQVAIMIAMHEVVLQDQSENYLGSVDTYGQSNVVDELLRRFPEFILFKTNAVDNITMYINTALVAGATLGPENECPPGSGNYIRNFVAEWQNGRLYILQLEARKPETAALCLLATAIEAGCELVQSTLIKKQIKKQKTNSAPMLTAAHTRARMKLVFTADAMIARAVRVGDVDHVVSARRSDYGKLIAALNARATAAGYAHAGNTYDCVWFGSPGRRLTIHLVTRTADRPLIVHGYRPPVSDSHSSGV